MTKRIVSGVFLLVALGALGLILAGALTSGEQLIVRFLTAIIVAALGLYVISDLRLQADDSAVAKGATRPVPATAGARGGLADAPPPNSTAAFMATVTGKKSSTPASSSEDGGWSSGPAPVSEDLAKTGAVPIVEVEPLVVPNPDDVDADPTGPIRLGDDAPAPTADHADHACDAEEAPEVEVVAVSSVDASPYAEDDADLAQWPLTPDGVTVADAHEPDDAPVDALSAVFEKAEQNETTTAKPVISIASVFGSANRSESADDERTADDESAPETIESPAATDTAEADSPAPTEVAETADDESSAEIEVETATGSADLVVLDDVVAEEPSHRGTGEPLEPMSAAELAAASYAQARIIDLRLSREATAEIEAAIRSGEIDVISSLLDEGVLSPEGPINDRDVRTMVYVAFTSNELRKILLAGGTVDGDQSKLDLGPVEVFTNRPTTEPPTGPTSIGPGSTLGSAPALAAASEADTNGDADTNSEADTISDADTGDAVAREFFGPVDPAAAGDDTSLATVTTLDTGDTDDALESADALPADLSPFAASEG